MNSQYLGLFQLASTVYGTIVTRNTSNVPTNATTAPTFRVYGSGSVLTGGTGSLSFKDTGSITGATNASPIVITSASHGLSTGTRVTIAGVGGNTAANGDFLSTVLSSNTFSLDGSTGNGAYTSGGTWNVSGLYAITLTASGANGYEAGKNYSILVTATVSGNTTAAFHTFTIV